MLNGQLIIPQTKKIQKVKLPRKSPEPSILDSRPLKKFEILHRPFDLKFRGKINKWLGKRQELVKSLDYRSKRLVKLYFFPQKDKRWLSQAEVSEKLGINKYLVRPILVETLVSIWGAQK